MIVKSALHNRYKAFMIIIGISVNALESPWNFTLVIQVAGRQLWRQVAGASQFAGSLCVTRQILVMTSECSTLTIREA